MHKLYCTHAPTGAERNDLQFNSKDRHNHASNDYLQNMYRWQVFPSLLHTFSPVLSRYCNILLNSAEWSLPLALLSCLTCSRTDALVWRLFRAATLRCRIRLFMSKYYPIMSHNVSYKFNLYTAGHFMDDESKTTLAPQPPYLVFHVLLAHCCHDDTSPSPCVQCVSKPKILACQHSTVVVEGGAHA